MGLEVGAATAGSMSGMHCELVDTRATKPDAVIWGHGYGIVVNEHCKRFYDEGQRHLFATFEMIALYTWRDQNQKAYFVTDKVIMDRFRPGWVYDTTDKDPEESDTIEGLAEKLGLDPKELKKTVDEYNAALVTLQRTGSNLQEISHSLTFQPVGSTTKSLISWHWTARVQQGKIQSTQAKQPFLRACQRNG